MLDIGVTPKESADARLLNGAIDLQTTIRLRFAIDRTASIQARGWPIFTVEVY